MEKLKFIRIVSEFTWMLIGYIFFNQLVWWTSTFKALISKNFNIVWWIYEFLNGLILNFE